MKKQLLGCGLMLGAAFYSNTGSAQDFLGLSTGNYAGVTGVMLQPASIVDSRYKFDLNLFSTGINYSNNYVLLSRDAILKFNKNNFDNYQTFKSRYLSLAGIGNSEKVYFNVTNRTQIPLSFMATLSKRSAIALNIQSRSMIQGRNIPEEMARLAYGGFFDPTLTGSTINGSGFNVNTLNWAEVGLTYGRVLFSSNKHFLKAAFTGKYLAGIASIYLNSNDFRFNIRADSALSFNTTNFQYYHNEKADVNKLLNSRFNPDASTFGFDAGLVYEFRGNIDKFKYISRDDQNSYDVKERRDANKYMFKLGVSLLDMGMFTFDRAPNVGNFSGNVNGWRIRSQQFNNISDFDTALANRVTALPSPGTYNVYLPAALSVQLDIRFVKGFYLNAMSYTAVKQGKDAGYRFDGYNYFTITPRWESRHIGIYLPYTIISNNNVNDYKRNQLGATLRLGPLFIGSSNLGSMIFNNNLRAADVHAGLKIGITYGKPNKASKFIEGLVKPGNDRNRYSNDSNYNMSDRYRGRRRSDTVYVVNRSGDSVIPKSLPLTLDYQTGKVYTDPNRSGNVIVINNNYYYSTPPAGNQATMPAPNVNNTNIQYDSATRYRDSSFQTSQAVNDSVQRHWNDSIRIKKAKLDSINRRMDQLRKSMDSSNKKYRDSINKVSRDSINRLPAGKGSSASARIDSSKTDMLAARQPATRGSKIPVRKDSIEMNTLAARQPVNATAGTGDSLQRMMAEVESLRNSLYNDSIALRRYLASNGRSEQPQIFTTNAPIQQERFLLDTVAYAASSSKQLKQQQEEYKRYRQQSNDLENEIRSLNNQLANRNRYNNSQPNTYPLYIPPATQANSYPYYVPVNTQNNNTQLQNRRDTIYIRDTLTVRDTVQTSDTVTNLRMVTKRDTLLKMIQPQMGRMPAKIWPAEVLLFGLGKSDILPVYYDKLDYIATGLKSDSSLSATITGQTDATGSATLNRSLALKRAAGVKAYLVDKGVENVRIEVSALPPAKVKTRKPNSSERKVVIRVK